MCRVRTISRKGSRQTRESSETARQPPRLTEAKIQSVLHGDVERSAEMTDPLEQRAPVKATPIVVTPVTDLSEIPCRVSTHTCPAVSRETAENRLISGKPYLPTWQRAIPREVLVTP